MKTDINELFKPKALAVTFDETASIWYQAEEWSFLAKQHNRPVNVFQDLGDTIFPASLTVSPEDTVEEVYDMAEAFFYVIPVPKGPDVKDFGKYSPRTRISRCFNDIEGSRALENDKTILLAILELSKLAEDVLDFNDGAIRLRAALSNAGYHEVTPFELMSKMAKGIDSYDIVNTIFDFYRNTAEEDLILPESLRTFAYQHLVNVGFVMVEGMEPSKAVQEQPAEPGDAPRGAPVEVTKLDRIGFASPSKMSTPKSL